MKAISSGRAWVAMALLVLSSCTAHSTSRAPDPERTKILDAWLRATGRHCALGRYRLQNRDPDGSFAVKIFNKVRHAPSTLYLVTCGPSVYSLDVPDDPKYRSFLMRCQNGKKAYRRGCSWFH